jgi:hypothetical protein
LPGKNPYEGTNALTAKQLRFVQEYVKNGHNGAEAILAAGFKARTKNTARSTASRLLKNPLVAAEVARREQELLSQTQADQENIVKQLYAIVRADVRKVISWSNSKEGYCPVCLRSDPTLHLTPSAELDEDAALSIKSIKQDQYGKVTITMHDKVAAAGKLAAILGLDQGDDPRAQSGDIVNVLINLWNGRNGDHKAIPVIPGDNGKTSTK